MIKADNFNTNFDNHNESNGLLSNGSSGVFSLMN